MRPPPLPARIGRSVAGVGFRVAETDYSGGSNQAAHTHSTTGITLVLSGSLREVACGREEWASCLSVVVKPAGVVHSDQVGPRGARTIRVEIHDPALLPPDFGPWRWLHAGPGVRPLLSIARALRSPNVSCDDAVFDLLGELAATDRARDDPPTWLHSAREMLDDADPIAARVRDMANVIDVHPVSLARSFRRHYGVSVTTYRRRVRLRRAAAQIADRKDGLSRIAHAAGYSDHAHMCREIRHATGCTPSELRTAGDLRG